MNQVKDMLLGISIILVAIILSLFIGIGVVTALLVIIGIFLVLYGYFSDSNNKK
ncbi:hypothetical protein [Methanobacterium sp.]|uniref:hypothetical protein n=1 Tax=Methanobacterium sp. TaxID=2164 RepID=UPI003158E326